MKKIFIIAPHFPPSSLPPAQRARLIVKHCKNLDYYPYIFTANPKYREEKKDLWITELAGNDFDLFVVKTMNPKKTRKFGIGDLGLRMLPDLYKQLKNKAKKIKPDFILYLVPPWYILTIAKKIKQKTKIPYGIDFIDPWVVATSKKDNIKKKLSQKIAKIFEKQASRNANIIFSVSEGINKNLIKYHSLNPNKPLFAIPYGVEPSDFNLKIEKENSDKIIIRYIGAVWKDAYPVLKTLLHTLSIIEKQIPLKIEFFGTSYANQNLAKPQTTKWIEQFNMSKYMFEQPMRVPYKRAVELTLSANIILLFGGMQAYYAASKLMGVIASGVPFIAFLHKNSFPAKFLSQLNYNFAVYYSDDEKPHTKLNLLKSKIIQLLETKNKFIKFDMNNPKIKNNTAESMTKKFLSQIEKIINNDKPQK